MAKIKSKGIEIEVSPEVFAWFERELPQAPDSPDVDDSPYDPEADPEFVGSYLKLEFVEELRNVMHARGLSGSDLARKLRKSRQAVSKALSKDDPDNFTIEKMAELVTAVGARVSIKVHEPGTMVVTKPMPSRTSMATARPTTSDLWQPTMHDTFQVGYGKGTATLRADVADYKKKQTLSIREAEDQDEQPVAA